MAKDFENGVSWYETGKAVITIAFPEGDRRCRWCRFCRAEESLNRWWCRLTNNIVQNPYVSGLPMECPIEFVCELQTERLEIK